MSGAVLRTSTGPSAIPGPVLHKPDDQVASSLPEQKTALASAGVWRSSVTPNPCRHQGTTLPAAELSQRSGTPGGPQGGKTCLRLTLDQPGSVVQQLDWKRPQALPGEPAGDSWPWVPTVCTLCPVQPRARVSAHLSAAPHSSQGAHRLGTWAGPIPAACFLASPGTCTSPRQGWSPSFKVTDDGRSSHPDDREQPLHCPPVAHRPEAQGSVTGPFS